MAGRRRAAIMASSDEGKRRDDGLGAIRMSLDDGPHLEMPIITVKPNHAIPVTVGILLILGSLYFAFSSFSNLYGSASEEEAEALAVELSTLGEEVTKEQIMDYFAALEEKNYFLTLGIIEALAFVLLMSGGILLIRKDVRGVFAGGAGGAAALIDGAVSLALISSVETPTATLGMLMRMTSALAILCGLVCTLIPALPIMLAAGRASLQHGAESNSSTEHGAMMAGVMGAPIASDDKFRDIEEEE